MKHRFNDIFTRDDYVNLPFSDVLSRDEACLIADAVAENPKANLAAHISLYKRCAADTRKPGLGLFQTSNPLNPNWGSIEQSSPAMRKMIEELHDVYQSNVKQHSHAQIQYLAHYDGAAQYAFKQNLVLKFSEQALEIATPIAEKRFAEEQSNRPFPENEAAQKAKYNLILESEMSTALYQLMNPELNKFIARGIELSKAAGSDLHNRSWHDFLADCFSSDVLPAFAAHCKHSNPEVFEKTIDRVNAFTIEQNLAGPTV